MKCVALKIKNGVAQSGADIINIHYKKEKEAGKVYYSTNVPFDSKREMEKILFYFNHRGILKYVLADIIKCKFNKIPFTPNDDCKYSPTQYQNIDKKSWFLIENMREVGADFINYCVVEYSNKGDEKLLDVINSKTGSRINRVYFNKLSENKNDEDILIK